MQDNDDFVIPRSHYKIPDLIASIETSTDISIAAIAFRQKFFLHKR